MIIRECYIENFGKLSKFNLVLNKGLNTIIEENGFGKTTLAAFIKAMFYGLEKKNERDFYSPWQGGKYGGYIIFEKEKKYRLERYFASTKSKDKFKLYDLDTNEPCTTYTDKIGLEIFGIDQDGFIKSTYFPQNQLINGNNDTITARLTNLIDQSDDINNYEKVITRIDEEIKVLKLIRGKGGLIYELEKEQEELNEKIDLAIKAKQEKEQLEKELDLNLNKEPVLENILVDTKKQIIEAGKQNVAFENIQTYKKYEKDYLEKKQELEVQKSFFKTIPSFEDIENIEKKIEYHTNLINEKNNLEANENPQYKDLKAKQLNSDLIEQIDTKINLANLYLEIKPQTELTELEINKRERYDELKLFFNKETSIEEINNYIELYRKTNIDSSRKESITIELDAQKSKEKKKINPLNFLFIGLSLIALVVGIILIESMQILGISLIVAGVIMFIIGFILVMFNIISIKSFNTAKQVKIDELIKEINDLSLEIDNIRKNIVCFISFYFESTPTDLEPLLLEIKEKYYEKNNLEKEIIAQDKVSSKAREKLDEIEFILKTYLVNFPTYYNEISYTDYLQSLYKIKNDYTLFKQLEIQKEDNNNKIKQLNEKISLIREEIELFLSNYYQEKNNYKTLITDLRMRLFKLNNLEKECSNLEKTMKEYFIEKNISKLINEYKIIDINALIILQDQKQKELDEIKALIISIKKEIQILEDKYEHLTEYELNLDEINLNLEKNKKKLYILEQTKNYLMISHKALTLGYVQKINNSLNTYTSTILVNSKEKYLVDTNLSVKVEVDGQIRDISSFSAGYKDILYFCIRCSIIDQMYKEEYPFLILDDPFVNLDKNKIELAKKVITKLEEKYQIIYLICHDARK